MKPHLSPLHLLLICASVAAAFAGCKPQGPSQEEALDYNNKIVDAQGEIMKRVIGLAQVLQQVNPDSPASLDTAQVYKLLRELSLQIDKSTATVQALQDPDTLFPLKARALDLFAFYKKASTEYYPNFIGSLSLVMNARLPEAEREAAMNRVEELQNQLSVEEQTLDAAFNKVQTEFSRHYNIQLQENALQRELNRLNPEQP
jgi:hypothetical protein